MIDLVCSQVDIHQKNHGKSWEIRPITVSLMISRVLEHSYVNWSRVIYTHSKMK